MEREGTLKKSRRNPYRVEKRREKESKLRKRKGNEIRDKS